MKFKPLSELSPGDIIYRWNVEYRSYCKGLLLGFNKSFADIYWYVAGENECSITTCVSIDEPPEYLNKLNK
jgi:hypothetical protein